MAHFKAQDCLENNLYRNKGGKYLTIVEGECDAMAVNELLQDKWASLYLLNEEHHLQLKI